jgi:hypothetical protein
MTTAQVVERDDGLFEIGVDGDGPFPTRIFAEAVASKRINHPLLADALPKLVHAHVQRGLDVATSSTS